MSEASQNGDTTKGWGLFDSTKRAYWGGPWYPYWSLIAISLFGGFLGLDHLWLRSPLTAIAKFLFNLFSFGLWYFYDLLQILGERDSVQKNGLSIPIVGAAGIGSGMFRDNQPGVPLSRSPLRWIAYMFLVFLPFGFDLLVAGDMNGAAAKFISSITIFLLPITIIWTLMDAGKAWLVPKKLWDNGTSRMFPFTFFMDKQGPSVLGPVDIAMPKDGCDPGGASGIFKGSFIEPIAQTIIGSVLPGVIPATVAATTAVKLGADTASALIQKTGDVTGAVLDAVKNPAVQTVSLTSGLVQQIPKAVDAIPTLATKVGNNLEAFSNPATLRAAAGLPAQIGGGASGSGIDGGNSELSNIALLVFFLGLFSTGSYLVSSRLNIQVPFLYRADATGPKPNDSPPKP